MKRLLPLCLVVGFATPAPLRAGAVETAIVAAMRLSEQPNYSWITTISDDARTYDIRGQTTRGGFTRIKMPVVNSVRRRMGHSVTDTDIDLIFRGNADCVLATDDGWKTLDELPPPDEEPHRAELGAGSGNGIPGSGSIAVPPRRSRPEREERHYSNLQLAISHPHEELGVIVSSHGDFKVEGDIVTGTLTELGAQLLLVHDGQKELTPLRAAGTFKLWLHEGMVAKYQLRLEGLLEIDTPKGRRQIIVHQNADTILKDVGATRFDVPEAARERLSR